MTSRQEYLRNIPAVTIILQDPLTIPLVDAYTHGVVVETIGKVIQQLRQTILAARSEAELISLDLSCAGIINSVKQDLKNQFSPKLKPVINATGVVLHTNLGRAILSKQAVEAVTKVAANYSNLELNLETGKRGSRYDHVEEIICRLTGAEAALVVNNNAAAVLLVLSSLAREREVIVSRGQLVEIGGSFRIPEVMRQSGATLVEVGATNKTHLRDFAGAITAQTAALLRVHTSNYRIIGFTQDVALEEMVNLARQYGLPVIDDLGSGVLINFEKHGLPAEPTVQASIAAGVDLVTCSGDKLLGGPQAGIIVGKATFIEKIKKNQLTRALRVDKFTFAALEATLRLYLDENQAMAEIPTLRMLNLKSEDLLGRAKELAAKINEQLGPWYAASVCDGMSQVGGGSLPGEELPTQLVMLQTLKGSVTELEQGMRNAPLPILARIARDRLLIDCRTVLPEQDQAVFDTLQLVGRQLWD